MTDSLRHRGPDSGGIWADNAAGIALGHRRLAVVDLSEAGRQPMRSSTGRHVVSFNGEIYNFQTVRAELQDAGVCFRGHSDTEVMLAAFDRLGVAATLPKLAGMFAIALWDRPRRALHLIRDRMGKKPLYIAVVPGALLFASELRAFHAFPGFRPQINRAAVDALLRYGWIPDDMCVWDDVFKLPPGSCLEVTADDLNDAGIGQIRDRIEIWWSASEMAARGQRNLSRECASDLEDELDRLINTAVRERMVADVPLGAFLSGGIDSTTVVAAMQAQSCRPVHTFTIGFTENGYNEADHADAIARHLGTDHTRLDITPAKAQAVIPQLPRIYDEPFADESQIPTVLVAQLARQHVTVAITGDGGDEAFGGYRRHTSAASVAALRNLPSATRAFAASALSSAGAMLASPLARRVPVVSSWQRRAYAGDFARLASIIGVDCNEELYDVLISASSQPAERGPMLRSEPGETRLLDMPSRFMLSDMRHYLPGDVLVKVDRATMAFALEARSPLLDHRIVEFAWRTPPNLKIRAGTNKWLLRQVLKRYVPEALYNRPKAGFNVPIGAWIAGPLREWACDLLGSQTLRQTGLIEPMRVDAIWRDHARRSVDRSRELWAILMLAAWLEAQRAIARPVAHVPLVCKIPEMEI